MPVLLCLPPLLLLLPQDIEAGARRSASTQALNKLARSRNASTVSLSGLNELANGGSPNGAPVNGAANGAANGHLAAAAKALGEGEHKSADDSAAESTPGGSPKKTVKPAAGNGYRLTNSSPKSSAAPTPALPGARRRFQRAQVGGVCGQAWLQAINTCSSSPALRLRVAPPAPLHCILGPTTLAPLALLSSFPLQQAALRAPVRHL